MEAMFMYMALMRRNKQQSRGLNIILESKWMG